MNKLFFIILIFSLSFSCCLITVMPGNTAQANPNYQELLNKIFPLLNKYKLYISSLYFDDNDIAITTIKTSILEKNLRELDGDLQISRIGKGSSYAVECIPQIIISMELKNGGNCSATICDDEIVICFEEKLYYFRSRKNQDLYQLFAINLFNDDFWSSKNTPHGLKTNPGQSKQIKKLQKQELR